MTCDCWLMHNTYIVHQVNVFQVVQVNALAHLIGVILYKVLIIYSENKNVHVTVNLHIYIARNVLLFGQKTF